LRGWENLASRRQLLGRAQIGCGMLLVAIGLGLWWITGLKQTWGWYL
jgi:hypothetical protein